MTLSPEAREALSRHGFNPDLRADYQHVTDAPGKEYDGEWLVRVRGKVRPHVCELDGVTVDGHTWQPAYDDGEPLDYADDLEDPGWGHVCEGCGARDEAWDIQRGAAIGADRNTWQERQAKEEAAHLAWFNSPEQVAARQASFQRYVDGLEAQGLTFEKRERP